MPILISTSWANGCSGVRVATETPISAERERSLSLKSRTVLPGSGTPRGHLFGRRSHVKVKV